MQSDRKPVWLRNFFVPFRKLRTALRVAYSQGVPSAIALARKSPAAETAFHAKHQLHSLVRRDDILNADWSKLKTWHAAHQRGSNLSYKVAWIMSPPGVSSGGHQNIYRFIDVLEKHGHVCTIYLYDSAGNLPAPEEAKRLTDESDAYPNVRAEVKHYGTSVDQEFDAIFATGWETAYPSFTDSSSAQRFYFIQDYEPLFYALGTDSKLAENTYRFGFHGITAGGWLDHKVSTEFGMDADHFDFAVDPSLYNVTNTDQRDEVFFYARPVTPRRAFEFGILVLQELLRIRPDTVINFAGWDVTDWEVPFPYVNLGPLPLGELNKVYNRCGAALVLSLSNMSLLPLELIAAGVVPVVNDDPNNRMVSDSEFISYEPLIPTAMAEKLREILDSPLSPEERISMSSKVSQFTWKDSGEQFIQAFERKMND